MKKVRSLLPLISIFIVFILVSCNKKEGCTDANALNFDPDAQIDNGCIYEESFAVELHMHQYMLDEQLITGGTYNINGVQTKLTVSQFYISNIRLVDANDNETAAAGFYLLINPEQEEYSIGNFPAGDYTKIKFNVGVDSATNHGDPSLYAIGDPLGAQIPFMHWSWSFGYIFLRIDGEADVNGDGITDNPDGLFEMHLGTESYLASIEVDLPVTIGATNENICHLATHWDMFFAGVDVATDNTTHATDNEDLADILFGNIFTMFSEEIE